MKQLSKHLRLLKLFFISYRKNGLDKLTIVLNDSLNEKKESDTMRELKRVAMHIGIDIDDLCSKTRKRNIVEARQVAMYLAKRNTKESLAKIGLTIGGKGHATVLHAVRTTKNLLETDRQYREKWMPLIINNY